MALGVLVLIINPLSPVLIQPVTYSAMQWSSAVGFAPSDSYHAVIV